jgi:hypothetical protein
VQSDPTRPGATLLAGDKPLCRFGSKISLEDPERARAGGSYFPARKLILRRQKIENQKNRNQNFEKNQNRKKSKSKN